MQTFLPYDSFAESAKTLDRRRLCKQRVEVLQILRTLKFGGAWRNHPAVLMWKSYENALAEYGIAVCKEWISKKYKDTCMPKIEEFRKHGDTAMPKWFGLDIFHRSHKANLLRKDLTWYSKFGWNEDTTMPYFWPTKNGY